jgi:hypothetical protein
MRKEQDQKDATLAREIYSKDQFRTIFSYRKQGKVLVMSRDQDIARRYDLTIARQFIGIKKIVIQRKCSKTWKKQ